MDHHHDAALPDFGTGEKKLGIYFLGITICSMLTLASFWAVMSSQLSRSQIFVIIYVSACIQCLVQVVCFLRLNTQTEQSRINVMAILFTIVILISIIVGSLWIMSNLNYNMMH